MSKLADKAKSSKLASLPASHPDSKPERLTTKINIKEYPRSYRLDYEVMNLLRSTLARINEVSPKKVSEARLIKALIHLAAEIDNDKIIKALKEVW